MPARTYPAVDVFGNDLNGRGLPRGEPPAGWRPVVCGGENSEPAVLAQFQADFGSAVGVVSPRHQFANEHDKMVWEWRLSLGFTTLAAGRSRTAIAGIGQTNNAAKREHLDLTVPIAR